MWKNTTSYSKSDDKSEVRTTSLKVDGLEITVTRYVGYGYELVMHCHNLGINKKPLGMSNMEEAQEKALKIVKARAKKILYAVEQI